MFLTLLLGVIFKEYVFIASPSDFVQPCVLSDEWLLQLTLQIIEAFIVFILEEPDFLQKSVALYVLGDAVVQAEGKLA